METSQQNWEDLKDFYGEIKMDDALIQQLKQLKKNPVRNVLWEEVVSHSLEDANFNRCIALSQDECGLSQLELDLFLEIGVFSLILKVRKFLDRKKRQDSGYLQKISVVYVVDGDQRKQQVVKSLQIYNLKVSTVDDFKDNCEVLVCEAKQFQDQVKSKRLNFKGVSGFVIDNLESVEKDQKDFLEDMLDNYTNSVQIINVLLVVQKQNNFEQFANYLTSLQQDISWDQFQGLMDDELIDKINNFYSKRPTQIQIESLGISLDKKEGKSLGIIRAPGGSGKTLCYAIPALQAAVDELKINANPLHVELEEKINSIYSPKVIILADTRLLCEQIKSDLEEIIPNAFQNKINISIIYKSEEIQGYGAILVGMPKQIADLVKDTGTRISLENLKILAVDEADQTFKLQGESVNKIIKRAGELPSCKLLLVSATMNSETLEIVKQSFFQQEIKTQKDFSSQINYNQQDLVLNNIRQNYCILPPESAKDRETENAFVQKQVLELLELIYSVNPDPFQTIIFFENKDQVENFYKQAFEKFKFKLNPKFIHNQLYTPQHFENEKDAQNHFLQAKMQNKLQKEIYQLFSKGDIQLLISTDIISRGIDFQKVGLVINVFAPRINIVQPDTKFNLQSYVHRIARTGRYIQKGISLIFLRNPENKRYKIKDPEILEQLKNDPEILLYDKIHQIEINKYQNLQQQIYLTVKFNKQNAIHQQSILIINPKNQNQ